ncbi:MAG: UDP-N-acetylmuramoyl-tripeptide--D-alanyl-D-alanine ligase, partial [Steroidobacteraceae bacterium]
MKRTLAEFARACGGRLSGSDRAFSNVVSDSRTLQSGELFIALRGPKFNGNEFVGAAASAGAAGAVVDAEQPVKLAQILVRDTQAALERAARAWRAAFSGALVGVAGSNGKTTAKEMTAAILGQVSPCLATRGNLNNHIGVPLTLLRLTGAERFAVVEMGADRPGEVAQLVSIARPTIGVITNAGAEHLAGFGSLEGVARAEGEMVAGLAAGATAVINADDEFAGLWRRSTRARVVTFGVHAAADFSASEVRTAVGSEGFSTHFRLSAPLGAAAILLRLGGAHNVANALAAAA